MEREREREGGELTMIVRGEPYMMMEKTVAAMPQKSFLALPWRARRETRTTIAKTVRTRVNSPRILVFSFFGANKMKINTYTISITAPVPFMVDTSRLLGDTKGMPYLFIHIKYFISTQTILTIH